MIYWNEMPPVDNSILDKYGKVFTQKRRISARPHKNTLLVYLHPNWIVKVENNNMLNNHQHRIGRPKR